MKKLNRSALILALMFLPFVFTVSTAAQTKTNQKRPVPIVSAWPWPKKFDAVAAASKNHQVVYEDNGVRVLQVICPPGQEEPVHTHRYKSTMWFTKSARFIYYTYVSDQKGRLAKKDSVVVNGFPIETLNKGQLVEREGPHSVRNTSMDTLMAYRVEYKKGFKN